ncbi:MAG: MBL fold metallo-hydrolase [Bacteroidota bacterium]
MKITGYSTALFSTWFFLEEYGILFDAGDGVSASLMGKGGKIKHIFISHADRDHITGLFQVHQLNARPSKPLIIYPKDAGSFPAMASFMDKFDPHVGGAIWQGIEHDDQIQINKELRVEALRNEHVQIDKGITKSLSYKLVRAKRKLKPEFQALAGKEIGRLRKERGENFVTEEKSEILLAYSGDTPVDDYSKWDNSQILIHEATFMGDLAAQQIDSDRNLHSSLEEVMEMLANIQVGKVILSHFSSRYSADEIDHKIAELRKHYGINIPIHRIFPGKFYKNILEECRLDF